MVAKREGEKLCPRKEKKHFIATDSDNCWSRWSKGYAGNWGNLETPELRGSSGEGTDQMAVSCGDRRAVRS